MSKSREIDCLKCGEQSTLKTRSEFDGCCWACGAEIDLEDYLARAMDESERLRAEVEALREAAGKAITWLDAEQKHSGDGVYKRLKLCRDAENSLRASLGECRATIEAAGIKVKP